MNRTCYNYIIRKRIFSQFYTIFNFSRLTRNLPLKLLRWPSKLTLSFDSTPSLSIPASFQTRYAFKILSMRRISSSAVKLEPFFLLVLDGRSNCTSIAALRNQFYFTITRKQIKKQTTTCNNTQQTTSLMYTFHFIHCMKLLSSLKKQS